MTMAVRTPGQRPSLQARCLLLSPEQGWPCPLTLLRTVLLTVRTPPPQELLQGVSSCHCDHLQSSSQGWVLHCRTFLVSPQAP